MANALLTSKVVTRETLRVFHQKATFIGSINRKYDDKFSETGAKIGDTLNIRVPNRFKSYVGLDQTNNFQDTTETSVALQVGTLRSVPMKFTDLDLSLSLDDFSDRIIKPAMTQLAADVENDVLSTVYADVYNQVGTAGTVPSTLRVLNQARAAMTNGLAPYDERAVLLNPDAQVEIVDNVKGLFQDSAAIKGQYRDGLLGRTAGFGNIYEHTLVPTHTNGSATGAHTVTTTVATEGANTINITGSGTQTLKRGTVFTIAGRYAVHPESKAITPRLQQFVVTADATAVGGAYTNVAIAPAMSASALNPRQNIASMPSAGDVINLVGAAGVGYAQNLAYHKDAFTFATADLSNPKGSAAFAAVEQMDGISMRVWKDWDIKSGVQFSRVDILYGFKTIRPEAAVRITA
ncbi:hypothetical protein KGP36_07170 [Patescibacteria group bacterium]|nr:hypothetical protein [Patescibacteria group bacterium]